MIEYLDYAELQFYLAPIDLPPEMIGPASVCITSTKKAASKK